MKNIILSSILIFSSFATFAQTQGALWAGSRSTDPTVKAVHQSFASGYDGFIAGNNTAWEVYSEQAVEVDPGGNVTFGREALKAGMDAFFKMTEEKPIFSYSNVQVRILTSDVALILWDADADIKIGGQQVGGKTKGLGVMRKINGQWKLEANSMTPVQPMPGTEK